MPTATIISTAFLNHARLAAKNLHIDNLPLVVGPHPFNDLTPEELRELAQAAYPLILEQLTGQGTLPLDAHADFVHPAKRNPQRHATAARKEVGPQ